MGPATAKDLFKYEFSGDPDSRPPPPGQMFNHFYDKLRDVNGLMGVAFGGASAVAQRVPNSSVAANPGSPPNGAANMFYEEYDSNSDSDEEISVT